MAQLQNKFQMVRDFTGSVASGRTPGFYLYGAGGCGKSFTIINELERLIKVYADGEWDSLFEGREIRPRPRMR